MNTSNKLDLFKHILNLLQVENNESLLLSLDDVHSSDIFSLVVDGTEAGKLTRIFIANKDLKPFDVQYHTHRYPICLTVIAGEITHHTAQWCDEEDSAISIDRYEYQSPLTGGNGLTFKDEIYISCNDYKMPAGSSVEINTYDFHTMSVSKGSMWVVQELGFEKAFSYVLGIPFKTEGLYKKPDMADIDHFSTEVQSALKNIISAY